MIHLSYLAALLVGLSGMTLLDWRYNLALFDDTRRALLTVFIGVVIFVAWDALGIGLGIFFSGHSQYMSGIYVAPEFPLEELFFLTFLCYFTLVMFRLGEQQWRRT